MQTQSDDHDEIMLMRAMRQQLGSWGSDHREEAKLLRGWNYIGITPICKMAASATASVYDDTANPQMRTQRRSLRTLHGPKWKSLASETDKGKAVSSSHRLYRLITRPNPWQSGGMFRWDVIQQMHLHGGAIVWRVRDRGKTRYRIPIPVSITNPILPERRSATITTRW